MKKTKFSHQRLAMAIILNNHAARRFASLAVLVVVVLAPLARAQFAPSTAPVARPTEPTPRKGILNVRLVAVVEANIPQKAPMPELKDVLPLLKANLRYGDYRLIEDRNVKLRPGIEQEFPDGFRVFVSDIDNLIMTVSINRHKQSLLRTRLRLRVGRPLVIGPFTHPRDTNGYILIFKLKN